jgi:hypothetical protein
MSTGSIANDAARLTRTLRIEDVLINAAAVPLPIDLSPSQLPQPDLDTHDATNDAQSARANSPATEDAPQASADPPPAHAAPAEDAVTKSLQAAQDAIHDSLQTATGDQTPQASATPPSDAHASDLASVSASHPSAAGDIAPSTQLLPGPDHPLPQLDLPTDVAALFPAGMADGGLANVLHDVQAVVGDLGGLLGSIAGAPIDLAATVAPATAVVADVAAAVDHVAQSAIGLIIPTGGETHPDAAAHANTAAAPTAAPPPGAPEAVTVPSLHGAGFDALAGLLQPAPAIVEPAHDVAPAHIGMDDLSLLPPIGLEDIAHSDQAASHPAHALPPAGSGLI